MKNGKELPSGAFLRGRPVFIVFCSKQKAVSEKNEKKTIIK